MEEQGEKIKREEGENYIKNDSQRRERGNDRNAQYIPLAKHHFYYLGVAEIILKSQTKMSLKCLAAKSVRKYNLSYLGKVLHCLSKKYCPTLYFLTILKFANPNSIRVKYSLTLSEREIFF